MVDLLGLGDGYEYTIFEHLPVYRSIGDEFFQALELADDERPVGYEHIRCRAM